MSGRFRLVTFFELLALVESILADHGDVVSDGNSGEPRFVFEGISQTEVTR